jgi:signal transduction histidine kinase
MGERADDGRSRESADSEMSDRRQHNRTLLRRYAKDILEAGDMAAIDEIFHEDIEGIGRDGRTLSGRDDLRAYLREVRGMFANMEAEVDTMVATESEVMAQFEMTAVHEEEFFGVDPSDREVSFRLFSRAVVEDGKMIDQGDLLNPLRLQPPAKRHGRASVLEQIHDGVLVVDDDDRIVHSNPAARAMLWDADRDLLNEPLDALFDSDVDPPVAGSSKEITVEDDNRVLDLSASRLTNPQDERVGRIIVMSDVTEQARRREQLRMLSERNERLDEFATVLAHDLRNPLNAADAALELARETEDEEYFEKVSDAHGRMATMISDLLSMARGGVTVRETEQVMLADRCQDAWETARTEGATLRVDVPRAYTVDADSTLLGHVLENLYRNARDHNDPPVTITVGTLNSEAGFFIADDGAGIPAREREDVFEHGFSTSDDGTGLGLSIVGEFASAHGWEITATESDSGGARFEIVTDPAENDDTLE